MSFAESYLSAVGALFTWEALGGLAGMLTLVGVPTILIMVIFVGVYSMPGGRA